LIDFGATDAQAGLGRERFLRQVGHQAVAA